MPFKVTIFDTVQRDRLALDLERMRDQIKSLAASGPGPRLHKAHHHAILRSARSNARDLAGAIREFDKRGPAAKGPGGDKRDGGRGVAQRQGAGRVAESRAVGKSAPVASDKLAGGDEKRKAKPARTSRDKVKAKADRKVPSATG